MKLNRKIFFPVILQTISYLPTRLVFWVFTRFEVRGLENLKKIRGTGVIFASNHISEWDPILVTAALPWFSRFMPLFYTSLQKSKYKDSGWRKILYGGLFFKAWGAYPAYLGLKDYQKSLKHHIKILSLGGSLCVFPEGGKSKTGEMREYKSGVAFLMHDRQVPVVPILISGDFKMSLKDFLFRRRKIIVKFGEPLFPNDLFNNSENVSLNEYKNMARVIMNRTKELSS